MAFQVSMSLPLGLWGLDLVHGIWRETVTPRLWWDTGQQEFPLQGMMQTQRLVQWTMFSSSKHATEPRSMYSIISDANCSCEPFGEFLSCLLFVLYRGGVVGTSILENSCVWAVSTGGLEPSRRSMAWVLGETVGSESHAKLPQSRHVLPWGWSGSCWHENCIDSRSSYASHRLMWAHEQNSATEMQRSQLTILLCP